MTRRQQQLAEAIRDIPSYKLAGRIDRADVSLIAESVDQFISKVLGEERARIRAAVNARWQESERVPISAVLNLIDTTVRP